MNTQDLNEKQSDAVTYTDDPILILAGPGSGKTLTITKKVFKLIEDGLSPDRILALTFSEKAAGEMQDRIEQQIGVDSGITVSTFHSFCDGLIREFSMDLGIDQGVRLVSKEHAHIWGIRHIDQFGFENIVIPPVPYNLITSLLEGVSQYHDHLVSPAQLNEYVEQKLASCAAVDEDNNYDEMDRLLKLGDLARFYEHYQQYKWDHNFIDYDDMIVLACRLLDNNDIVRKTVQKRYEYVLVDEFQDTNYAQLHLIHLLENGGDLTCVADDDQCIYRFRGAYLSNIHQLEQFYPSLRKIPLDVNYRSTGQIVDLSQQLIRNNPDREEKHLVSDKGDGKPVCVVKAPDDTSEAEWVANEIKRLISEDGMEPRDIYILSRKRADGKKFSEALRRRMVPVEYVGNMQLKQFSVVQEALAYMKMVADPFNNGIAFAKVLAREGVSEHDLQAINQTARKLVREGHVQGDGIYVVLRDHLATLGSDQEELIHSILTRLEDLINYKRKHLPSDTLKHLLIDKTDLYRSQVHEGSTHSRRNIKILNTFGNMVEDLELIDGGSEFETVVEHLELVFDMEIGEGQSSDENTVKVMTIHQSKGKEARVVFVCDMAARHLPLDYRRKTFTVPFELTRGVQRDEDEKVLHLEEERRLAYVAMTRAKEQLYLVFPEKYANNVRRSKPSQFLDDVGYETNPLVDLIEAEQVDGQGELSIDSPLKQKVDEYERKLVMYARQSQFKHALESLVVLAQLREMEDTGSPEGVDIDKFLKVEPKDPSEFQDLIDDRVPSLVDPNMRFSASRIREYQDCPLKFKFNSVLGIPTPQKTYFQVGTDVHAVYEELAILKMQGKSPDLKLAKEILGRKWDGSAFDSDTHMQQEHGKIERMLEFWFEFEESHPNETVDVEERFDLIIDGAHFAGLIDRIDVTPKGEYVVIDYKSGKTKLSKKKMQQDVQLALYCLAVKKKYGKLPVRAGHLYVHPDAAELRLVDVNEENIAGVFEGIMETVKAIFSEDFEVTGKPVCRFCDYKGICEWYKENG